METILVPKHLNLQGSLTLSSRINSLPPDNIYTFDFSQLTFASPFGMVYATQAIKDLKTRYPRSKFDYQIGKRPTEAFSYACHVGFLKASGFNVGNRPGFKPNSQNYLPLTFVHVSQLYSKEKIQSLALGLAQQLAQENSGPLVTTFEYSFREIIRNVVEHSQSELFWYCAQYWPTKNLVEMAILDNGIGLKQSLLQNPHIRKELKDDQDALRHALMPGVSGKNYKGVAK